MKPALLSAFASLLCAAATLHAQSSQTTDTRATPPAPQPERAVSPRNSAAITGGFKWQPPPPPKPATAEDEVDLRDTDKPKNDIVRLPKYTVTAKKPEVFNDRTLYTQEQLKKLAMSRYLTKLDTGLLNKFTIPGLGISNEQRAMEMFYEEERQRNMTTVSEDVALLRATGNTERASETQSDYYDMFLRRRDDVHTSTFTRQRGE